MSLLKTFVALVLPIKVQLQILAVVPVPHRLLRGGAGWVDKDEQLVRLL